MAVTPDPTQELVAWDKQYEETAERLVRQGQYRAADDIRTLVDGIKQREREWEALKATHQALEARLERAVHIVGVLRQDMRPGDPFIVGVDEFLSAFNNQPTGTDDSG